MKALVNKENEGQRLDLYLLSIESDISRSIITRNIKDSFVSIDGKGVSKPSTKVHEGQSVTYELNLNQTQPDYLPIKLDLDIIFEDKDYLIINKQSGISTHPSNTETKPTLLQGVMEYLGKDFLQIGKNNRYGLVHRLDKDTSGVIAFAKSNQALWSLSTQFQKKKVKKEYFAVVDGDLSQVFKSKKKRDGVTFFKNKNELRYAVWLGRNPKNRMKYAVVENGKGRLSETIIALDAVSTDRKYTTVRLYPSTGRTHQLRVHLASLGYPIVGDKIYNNLSGVNLLLHAKNLRFMSVEEKQLEFNAAFPPYFDEFIKAHFE